MMKIMTILGTRPEIIRLSLLVGELDRLCQHILVYTGQNFDPGLSDVFFEQLRVRRPDHFLEVRAETFGGQVGRILVEVERVLLMEEPDRVLILGDTNSALSALVAKRHGIPVYHMEAGNRCYDDRVPEEVNRRMIDHSSDVLMPYTERSRANLLREGIPSDRIFVTGNPIYEVISHYDSEICQSNILANLGIKTHQYFLVTMHRAENVDIESRLAALSNAIDRLQRAYDLPVIVSTHPHTRKQMETFGATIRNEKVCFLPPFGFFEFVSLERNALCVLSDSGTVQEECCIYHIPNVTIRDVTERPETIECGSNVLSGADPNRIVQCVRIVLNRTSEWPVPSEYLIKNVSNTVTKIMLAYNMQSEKKEMG